MKHGPGYDGKCQRQDSAQLGHCQGQVVDDGKDVVEPGLNMREARVRIARQTHGIALARVDREKNVAHLPVAEVI